METTLKVSFLAALAFSGMLCGASLDQSIKQLPARRRIGVIQFSAYAKAADLKNGVLWYAIIGIGATIATVITAIVALKTNAGLNFSRLTDAAALAAIGHSICTSLAAPTYFKQKAFSDEGSLASIFRKFERIQTVRSVFVVVNFFCLLWALAVGLPGCKLV